MGSNSFLWLALLPLSSCGGGGSSSAADQPTQVSILGPVPGAVLNSATPGVVVAFADGQELDLSSARVTVNGTEVALEGWVLTSRGLSGPLPGLQDARHVLSVSVRSRGGATGSDTVEFETSTGGGDTRVRGVLIDPDGDVPIGGARIFIEELPSIVATTAADGSYELRDTSTEDLPSGDDLHVMFDPRALTFSDASGTYLYPLYKRKVSVVPDALNVLESCYLPKVRPHVTFDELAQQGIIDCASQQFLQPYTLSVDVSNGGPEEMIVELHMPAGVFFEFPDGARACDDDQILAIAPVDKTKAPSSLPPGADPSLLITVQPTGMRFRVSPGGAPASLPISFPNRDGFPAGTELLLFSVDHETGEFAPKGTMEVDGSDPGRIVTVSGGLEGGSWHCSCPPDPEASSDPEGFAGCEFDQVSLNPRVDTRTGFYREAYSLPTRRLFGEEWGDALVYSSQPLTERTILSADVRIPVESAVPRRVSVSATIAGIPIGDPIWYDTSFLPEDRDSAVSVAYPLDVDLPRTGLYPYQLAITNHFQMSSVTAFVSGVIPRVRQDRASFGQGWDLASESRIVEAVDGSLLLEEGGRGLSRFAPSILTAPGLQLTFYPFDEAPSSFWDNQVSRLFDGSTPMSFERIAPDEERATLLDTVIPSIVFPNQSSGTFFRYAGPNRMFEGSASSPAGDDLSFRTDGFEPTGDYGALFTGFLYVPFPDKVTFKADWDNGVVVEIDGQIVLAQVGSTGTSSSPPIQLEAGLVPIRVACHDFGGARQMTLYASGAGYDGGKPLPPSAFFSEAALETSDTYRGTRGDPSRIIRQEQGGFVRELPSGGREVFDERGEILERDDRRGRTTRYERDTPAGNLSALVDPVGGRTTFERVGGLVTSITDPAGRVTRLEHGQGRLTSVQDPTGAARAFEYDSRGFLVAAKDEDGNQNRFEVDAGGRLVSVDYADGTTAELLPYSNALLLSLANGAGSSEGSAAIPILLGSAEARLERPGAQVSTQFEGPVPVGEFPTAPDDARLWVRCNPLPDGEARWTLVVRESETRLVRIRQLRVGAMSDGWEFADVVAETRADWDALRGLPLQTVRSGLGTLADRITRYGWDLTAAWLTRLERAAGSADALVMEYVHDAQGNVVRTSLPNGRGGEAARSYEYDTEGLLVRVTDPTGVSVEYKYDSVTRSQTSYEVDGNTTQLALDDQGRVIRVVRPDGSATEYTRDALGRVTHVTDAEGVVTRHGFTPSGRLAFVQGALASASQRHEIDYDSRGRLRSWRGPLGATYSFSYYDDGNLHEITDPRGVVEARVFDQAGRLLRLDYRTSASAPVAESTAFTWTALDQLATATADGSTLRLEYSPFGERMREEQALSGKDPAVVLHTYDVLGRPSTMASTLGGNALVALSLNYGATGDLQRVDATLPDFQGQFDLTLDDAGRRLRLDRPGDVDTVYTYHPSTGRLVGMTSSSGGFELGRDALTYDDVLDIASWNQERTLIENSSLVDDRDGLSRLLMTSSADLPEWNTDYGPYDEQGNIRTDTNTYDVSDQLLSDDAHDFTYDASGNLLVRDRRDGTKPGRRFVWDLKGRLVRVSEGGGVLAEYEYDGLGRRIRTRGLLPGLPGLVEERYLYDGADLIGVERSDGPDAAILNGPGIDEPWVIVENGRAEILLADAMGSVTQWVVDGSVVAESRFGPFGEPLEASPKPYALSVFGYRGRPLDQATGLADNRARFYDPILGRFISRDSLELSMLGSPQPENSYAYGRNAPFEYADPTGKSPLQVTPLQPPTILDARRIPNPRDESRPVLWGILDLGPSTGGLGCGSDGTEFVPDIILGIDLGPACDIHDACSVALDVRNNNSLGEVLSCQVDFATSIVDQDGPFETVGAVIIGVPYTAVVTTVAGVHWVGSRVLDVFDALCGE